MNLIAPPFGLIVGGVMFGLYGLIGSLVIFFILFGIWKRVGKYDEAKLSISPSFTFGNKKYQYKNKEDEKN